MEEPTQENHVKESSFKNDDESASSTTMNTETESVGSEQQHDVSNSNDDVNSEKSARDSECSEDEGDHSECDSDDDDASVVLEREEGDGQESAPNRKVDDDEDKRNPQYIPKRGTFYEHDDRTAVEEGGEDAEPGDKEREENASKKKIWSEKEATRWCHDRFNELEQAPKSRQELVSIYGYDIRNEEGPPRARRRRRYGRGPNKYTRNWEDEEAYGKAAASPPVGNPRHTRPKARAEDFPPLLRQQNNTNTDNENDTDNGNRVESSNGDEHSQNSASPKKPEATKSNEIEEQSLSKPQQHIRSIRNSPRSKPEETPRPSNANTRGITRTRGFRSGGRPVESNRNRIQKNQSKEDEYSDFIISQNFTNKSMNQQQQQQNVQDLEKGMSCMKLQESSYGGSGRGGTGAKFGNGSGRQTSMPPRLQAEARGSKRYSSLRQRSLPDTASPAPAPAPTPTPTPTFGQHPPTYYTPAPAPAPEYGQPNGQQQSQQGLLGHPNPSQLLSVASNGAGVGVGVSVVQYGPQYAPAAGAYLQPAAQAPPPPAYLQPAPQPPPPQILNYAQPPPQFPQPPPPPPYTNYQQFTPVNQGQPAELYQPQGGITYYSTQNQQIVPRIPAKRPKAAIPIVPPPPPLEARARGRGRLPPHDESSPPVGPKHEPPLEYSEHDANIQYANDVPVVVHQ